MQVMPTVMDQGPTGKEGGLVWRIMSPVENYTIGKQRRISLKKKGKYFICTFMEMRGRKDIMTDVGQMK